MITLLSIILGLLVLSVLVFIHEFGHFIAAKANGIRVIAFSIGFGRPIWKIKRKDTEYLISSIPFGGYVKMAGENIEDRKGESDEFYSKSIPQRISVALAGPLFNYIAAILMLWIMFIIGIERPTYLEKPVVGAIEKNSPASEAGFISGDSIITINGRSIGDWIEIEEILARGEKSYSFEIIRNGEKYSLLLKKPESEKKEVNWGLHPPLPAKFTLGLRCFSF
ncbi:MAG: RIP metalloprotease RseP [Chitinispirillaceae bacterium]|nr:RIP metalloprotease RseP [Chitinispirillaceae bacterium]